MDYMVVRYRPAEFGHLAALQWTFQHVNDNYIVRAAEFCSLLAVEGGHLAVLQWLQPIRCALSPGMCSIAAAGGHLAVVQWLQGIGCPWDEGTCSNPAHSGRLAILQWARAH